MRKLPRHVHYSEESQASYESAPSQASIPVLDWTKMAFQTWEAFQAFINVTKQNICDIIGDVVTFIEWTGAQILTVFVNWGHLVATAALGLLDFAQNLWTGILKGANLGTFGVTQDYTLAKFADGFFTADATGRAKIADSFITEIKLASDAVSSIKIKDYNVTVSKVSASFLNSVNFILNPSFEDDIDSDGKPDGWNAGVWAGSPTWGRSTVEVKSGKYSFFLNCPVGASAVLDYLQFIPILPSTQYYYGTQAKGSVANTPCGVGINWYQKDKTTLISSSYVGTGVIGTAWDIRDGTVTSPSNAGWAQIEIFTSVQSYPYILYIDDVVFTSLITTGILATGCVIADKIATGTITALQIHADAIETDKILAGAVVSSKIALWRLTSDPSLIAGMLWWRSDLNQIRFYDGTTVQYIKKFPLPMDSNSFLSFTWDAFYSLISGGLSAISSAGAIATGAISALGQMADSFFTGVSGLAKFAAELFTADATGRGKFADLFVTTAKIDNLAVTGAKIDNATIGNAKISDLDAGKINAGYISVDRIQTESLVVGKLSEEARAILGSSDNLVFNGSFEDDVDNDSIPDGWHDYENRISRSSTYSYNGTYSLKILPQISWNAAESRDIEISKRPLVLIFWHRGSGTSGNNMFPYISFRDANHDWIEGTFYTGLFITTTTWTEYVGLIPQANIPSNARYLYIGLDNNDSSVTLYIDDIKLYYQVSASAMLADAIIGTAKIIDLAVTGAKIALATIDTAQIKDAAITNLKILSGTVEFSRCNSEFAKFSFYQDARWITSIEALTGYQVTTQGSGSVLCRKNDVKLLTGTTNNSLCTVLSYPTLDLALNPTFKARVQINNTGTITTSWAWVGVGNTFVNPTNGFGFDFFNLSGTKNLYAIWSLSGTTYTLFLQTFALNTMYILEARHKGTSIEFYVNGTLKGTATTDLPTSGLIEDFGACVYNSTVGSGTEVTEEVWYFTTAETWQ